MRSVSRVTLRIFFSVGRYSRCGILVGSATSTGNLQLYSLHSRGRVLEFGWERLFLPEVHPSVVRSFYSAFSTLACGECSSRAKTETANPSIKSVRLQILYSNKDSLLVLGIREELGRSRDSFDHVRGILIGSPFPHYHSLMSTNTTCCLMAFFFFSHKRCGRCQEKLNRIVDAPRVVTEFRRARHPQIRCEYGTQRAPPAKYIKPTSFANQRSIGGQTSFSINAREAQMFFASGE